MQKGRRDMTHHPRRNNYTPEGVATLLADIARVQGEEPSPAARNLDAERAGARRRPSQAQRGVHPVGAGVRRRGEPGIPRQGGPAVYADEGRDQ